ncbi:helix-turn-helix domain-containing protein [Pseudothauera rhizosphaerae]|uniref:Transcriptional regulator n=1 Tax=Pseudothauera rhizosphaerae TaxID=2565932 RepID=A0A4S4AMY5_9RHOO|nr:helix-turn-helix transcriptional regulator [Pseudothauera rhizosphaerae]THF60945.1 transcriptional regulator [Pseudothauera rhizosphaerae]
MATASAKKASQQDWHPADIKAALEKKGWTLRALAAHHGLSSSSPLSHTFLRSYPLNEKRIAEAIGVPVQRIWPSRYFKDGTPRLRGLRGMRRSAQSTALGCQRNGNSREAA